MASNEIIVLSGRLDTTAAGTDQDWDFPFPFPGTWELQTVAYSPDGVTAGEVDATNHAILTVETMDVIGNLAACSGTISNATVAFEIGTARTQALSGAATKVSRGDTIRIAKTEGGTGAQIFGGVVVTAKKVPENP